MDEYLNIPLDRTMFEEMTLLDEEIVSHNFLYQLNNNNHDDQLPELTAEEMSIDKLLVMNHQFYTWLEIE